MAKKISSSSPKKKMQNVSFKTVDELMDFLPPDQLKITEVLRKIVWDCIPDVKEKLSFNILCYSRKRMICFIWPGSISWGSVTQKGVRFGFQYGNLLNDESDYLEKGKRKQVYWRDFHSLSEIDADLLKSYIYEAVIVDQTKPKIVFSRKKKKK